MPKLKLDLDELAVTSFDVDDNGGSLERGTVEGQGIKPVQETEYNCETGQASCYYSACANIYNSCGYSCNCVTNTDNVVFCH
ncbi:MAG TPA: hypothetical protein VF665_03095 [Longimicrobium sp.]|jgi:hypothetical protein|uniref:hypothetical protein n=1 Tax=Longimicrobium sp. TaxID=2029185 RepID=UPI002ED89654